jgi:hypothetical protein
MAWPWAASPVADETQALWEKRLSHWRRIRHKLPAWLRIRGRPDYGCKGHMAARRRAFRARQNCRILQDDRECIGYRSWRKRCLGRGRSWGGDGDGQTRPLDTTGRHQKEQHANTDKQAEKCRQRLQEAAAYASRP